MYSPKSDGSTYNLVNKDRMVVKKSSIVGLILLIILILPSAVFSLGSVYESLTPTNISYDWLNYKFGILQVIICLVGTIEIICQKQFIFLIVSGLELIREVIFYLIYDNSIFSDSAYEVYLTFLVGYSLFLIANRYMDNFKMMDKFYGIFLITNMLTIYINVAMGGRGTTASSEAVAGLNGRYHASNLDVTGTGDLCTLCILYLFFSKMKNKYRYTLLVLSFLGLILSGARSSFVFLGMIIAFYLVNALFSYSNYRKVKYSNNIIYKIGIGIFVFVIFLLCIDLFMDLDTILSHINYSRYETLLSLQSIVGDDSFLGRSASLMAGIDVLVDNPLGISGYFINLQSEMIIRGYPTFPHSTLLSNYLLFGPVMLVFYFIWVKGVKNIYQKDRKYFWISVFYLISTIITGGPVMNFKVVFNLIISTYLIYKCYKKEFQESQYCLVK